MLNDRISGDKDLGAIVTKHRLRTGKSIRQLAREAGLHHGFVARIESGYRGLSVDSLAGLSESLGTAFLFEYLGTILDRHNAENSLYQLGPRPSAAGSQLANEAFALDTPSHQGSNEDYS